MPGVVVADPAFYGPRSCICLLSCSTSPSWFSIWQPAHILIRADRKRLGLSAREMPVSGGPGHDAARAGHRRRSQHGDDGRSEAQSLLLRSDSESDSNAECLSLAT